MFIQAWTIPDGQPAQTDQCYPPPVQPADLQSPGLSGGCKYGTQV